MNHSLNKTISTFYQQGEYVLILLALKPQLDQHLQQGLKDIERRPLVKQYTSVQT